MDNFMDKLVEKINAQGQIRPQNLVNNNDSESKEEMIKELTDKFQKDNAKVVELASQYKESIEDSIHKENVRCYRNTQAMVEENMEKLPTQITDGLKAEFAQLSEQINANVSESIIATEENVIGKLEKQIKSVKRAATAAFIFGLLNFAALVVILLWIFRII